LDSQLQQVEIVTILVKIFPARAGEGHQKMFSQDLDGIPSNIQTTWQLIDHLVETCLLAYHLFALAQLQ
jgi:hypothetical protein